MNKLIDKFADFLTENIDDEGIRELFIECEFDIIEDIDEAIKARAPKLSPKDELKKQIKADIMKKINSDPSFIDVSKKVQRLVRKLVIKYAPKGVSPKKVNLGTIKITDKKS